MEYTVIKDADGIETIVRDNEDASISYIPKDEANSDYKAYLKSLDEAKTK